MVEFAEQFIISSKFVMPIPDDISDELAVLIEPFAVAVSAVKKVKITTGTSVEVVGTGNIGIMTAILANHLGGIVTAIDPNPKKHDLVRQIDNIHVVFPHEAKNKSYDVVFEAAGTEGAVEKSIQLMKKGGGSLVIIGMASEVNIPVIDIVRNNQTIIGSIIYNFPEDYEETIEYLRNINVNISKIISKIIPIKNYLETYEAAESGDYAKIVLDFRK